MLLFYPEGYDASKLELATGYLLQKYGRSIGAPDILAACVKGMSQALEHHDQDRGAAFETYYRDVSEHEVLTLLKREGQHKRKGTNVSLDLIGDSIADKGAWSRAAFADLLDHAGLSESERFVLYAFYYEGNYFEDIGQKLGFSREWIRRVHDRAITKLKKVTIK